MTAHTHTHFVPGCVRCDLSRDEAIAIGDKVKVRATLDGRRAAYPATVRFIYGSGRLGLDVDLPHERRFRVIANPDEVVPLDPPAPVLPSEDAAHAEAFDAAVHGEIERHAALTRTPLPATPAMFRAPETDR